MAEPVASSIDHESLGQDRAWQNLAVDVHLRPQPLKRRQPNAPLTEFPELGAATPEQRANRQLTALGTAIYWPDIDEEFGLAGMLGISESALEEAAGFETYDLEARAE